MAHELERFSDGTASFVSAQQDAWHRLGTVLPDTFDATTALRTARLDRWNVHTSPLHITESGATLSVPDAYATVRTHPETGLPDVLGVVKGRYLPIQNEELTEVLDFITDESGAHFETAGSLRAGREVFVTMRLPETMTIAGTDKLDLYLAALNSHDGSAAMRLLVSPVRVVCANTQAAALADARSVYAIRHTSGARGRIAAAREALGMSFTYLEEFQTEAERMLDQQLTDGRFMDIVGRELWPEPQEPTERKINNRARILADVNELFVEADTQESIRGTAWAGYQSVVEYLDHYAPVKGKHGDAADAARAERILVQPAITALKTKAFDAFRLAA
ncbi:DUF932 domain-containing protein [Nocardiopsis sp. YSL2]|uniref:DUF932 domain-containing protein n=1 Tax=Nocardiopsis sp. YSL2 TaxID=2939492 RepID=UPI0026F46510|nr:DUF932 domain-containing protein [Nocardiopsis sp. YSL2]